MKIREPYFSSVKQCSYLPIFISRVYSKSFCLIKQVGLERHKICVALMSSTPVKGLTNKTKSIAKLNFVIYVFAHFIL